LPRRLGQHFLHHRSILDRIAAAACPEQEPLVIEIGPGKGALTMPLLARAEQVVAIEFDPLLAADLEARHEPRLTVVQGDFLKVDLTPWPATVIAGNLPYYITSPILEKVLPLPIKHAVFLMQKEVAERLVAVPGTREYGYLTVFTRLYAEPKLLFTVPPGSFQPPPKVDSAVVRLTRIPPSPDIPDVAAFLKFVSACFTHKRKTLRNNLSGLYGREALEGLPQAGQRAEQLSVSELAALFATLQGFDKKPC
jgi:16S rRNA (adenine1518-N6/adenine1519-N6)-dimethyltransferase